MTRRARLLCVLLLSMGLACRHVAPAPLSPEASADALVQRRLDDPGLRAFMQGDPEETSSDWPRASWGLADLTLAALYFQPDLRAARAGLGVAEAQARTAGQWPNPTLVVLPQKVAGPAAGVSPWLAAVQIDWTIETAGKRGHRRAAARARLDAAWLAVPSTAWALRGRLTEALIRDQAAAGRHEIALRSVALQGQLVELLEERLRLGATDQGTVLPERMALIGMRSEVARLQRLMLEARARLAAELALPIEALADIEIDFPLDREPADLDALAAADARRAAMLGRADLLSLLSEYAAAEADLRLELARQVPDVRLGPGYEFDQGQNKWGLALALDLPVLNQNQGGIGEAIARRQTLATRFEALQTRVITEVDSASASLRGARIELEQARHLVESTQERKRLVEAAFEAGAADRLALIASRLEVERASAILIDAQAQRQLSAAQLELAVQPDRDFARAVVASLPPEYEEEPKP